MLHRGAILSLSYNYRATESPNPAVRPEGLAAAMRQVLDFQGRLRQRGRPFFVRLIAALV
jgi:hypothetical protein